MSWADLSAFFQTPTTAILGVAVTLMGPRRGAAASPLGALPPLPEDWTWPVPSVAQVEVQWAGVERSDRACARRPSEPCAFALAHERGRLVVLLAQRAARTQALAQLDHLLEAIPAHPVDPGAWARELDGVAEGLERMEGFTTAYTVRERSFLLWELAAEPQSVELFRAHVATASAARRAARTVPLKAHAAAALDLATRQWGVDSLEYAEAQLVSALAWRGIGTLPQMQRALEETIRVRADLFGAADPGQKRATMEVLYNSPALLRHAASERELTDAIDALRESEGDSELVVRGTVELAHLLLGRHDSPEALKRTDAAMLQLEEAIRLIRTRQLSMPFSLARALADAGVVALRRGDPEGCVALQRRALSLLDGVVGRDHQSSSNVLADLGLVLSGMDRHAEAVREAEQAVEVFRHAAGETPWGYGTVLRSLALVRAHASDEEGAREAIIQALDIHTSRGMVAPRSLAEQEGLEWIPRARMSLDSALDILRRPEDAAALWEAAITWTGSIRAAAASRNRSRLDAPEAREDLDRLSEVREALSAAVAAGEDVVQIRALAEERDVLERRINLLDSGGDPGHPGTGLATIGLAEICALLRPDEALVQIVRYGSIDPYTMAPLSPRTEVYTAFVAPPGRCDAPVRVDLGVAAEVDGAATRWRAALGAVSRGIGWRGSVTAAGRDLRARIWDPLETSLRGARRVYLVPDGELALVPFGALPAAEDGFLLESVGFSYLDSARDLVLWERTPPAKGAGALVVGDVRYGEMNVNRTDQGGGVGAPCGHGPYQPLPGTAQEVRRVSRRLHRMGVSVALLTGDEADEARFSGEATGARLLHIATHGYFPDPSCLEDPEKQAPLSLSGLVLAHANEGYDPERGGVDGLMSAEEIASLDLRSVQLVVLSACGSGLGLVQSGEGAQGLRRAFALAGARDQVTSLSPVSDAATAALMDELYRGLARGLAAPEALLRAQRRVLARQRRRGALRVEDWGTFVATGSYSPIPRTSQAAPASPPP